MLAIIIIAVIIIITIITTIAIIISLLLRAGGCVAVFSESVMLKGNAAAWEGNKILKQPFYS